MEKLELDEDNHWVLWKADAEQVQKNELGWRMLEHNEIMGIIPFDYYYVDSSICFRYPYYSMQRMEEYFEKKSGGFDTLVFICRELLKIIERGQEYLLDCGGYLLSPEWIFWNRCEKKLAVCYLPGGERDIQQGYTAIVEYLMQHTDHKDKLAVTMIYGLYDLLSSDGFHVESLLCYLREMEQREALPKEAGTALKQEERIKTTKNKGKQYFLKPVLSREKASGLYKDLLCEERGRTYPVAMEEAVVGRSRKSDLYIPFEVISRHHALLFQESACLYVMDTSSKNGTYLNGNKISAYAKIQCQEGDVLTFADISYEIAVEKGNRDMQTV